MQYCASKQHEISVLLDLFPIGAPCQIRQAMTMSKPSSNKTS